MKKTFAIAALMAISMATLAQSHESQTSSVEQQPVVNWGIKAGANLSAFRVKNIPTMPDLKSLFGPGAEVGGYLDFNITHRFYVQFGLMFAYEKSTLDFGDHRSPLQSGAIEVPILAQWRWGNAERGWLSAGVGPYTQFIVWGDLEGTNPYRHVITDATTGDSTIVTGDNHSGLTFAIGYLLPCGLQFNASYHYGLSDLLLFEHDSRTTYQRPHKFTFGLGWRF